MALNAIRKKVPGASTGQTASKKMDGYAAGRVPESMLPWKPGLLPGKGYSGPAVAQKGRGD